MRPQNNRRFSVCLCSTGVSLAGNTLKVIVPAQRINRKTNFKFDAVTAYMEVFTGDHQTKLMLGVYEVYSVLSKKLTLPYSVRIK
ncbi:MAG: hypothetical protein M3367_08160 [Acidobacteriota bacterium]|nr:hypothetical protein [Acidobacteriota bacterium]